MKSSKDETTDNKNTRIQQRREWEEFTDLHKIVRPKDTGVCFALSLMDIFYNSLGKKDLDHWKAMLNIVVEQNELSEINDRDDNTKQNNIVKIISEYIRVCQEEPSLLDEYYNFSIDANNYPDYKLPLKPHEAGSNNINYMQVIETVASYINYFFGSGTADTVDPDSGVRYLIDGKMEFLSQYNIIQKVFSEYMQERTAIVAFMNDQALADLFELIKKMPESGTGVMLNSIKHSMTIKYSNNQFVLYDPNQGYSDSETELHTFDNIDDLILMIKIKWLNLDGQQFNKDKRLVDVRFFSLNPKKENLKKQSDDKEMKFTIETSEEKLGALPHDESSNNAIHSLEQAAINIENPLEEQAEHFLLQCQEFQQTIVQTDAYLDDLDYKDIKELCINLLSKEPTQLNNPLFFLTKRKKTGMSLAKQYPELLLYADNRLKQNIRFMKSAIEENNACFEYADSGCFKDPLFCDFCRTLLNSNTEIEPQSLIKKYCEVGNVDLIHDCLSRNNIDVTSINIEELLTTSIMHNQQDSVEMILTQMLPSSHQVEINHYIDLACEHERFDIAADLSQYNGKRIDFNVLFNESCYNGKSKIVKALLNSPEIKAKINPEHVIEQLKGCCVKGASDMKKRTIAYVLTSYTTITDESTLNTLVTHCCDAGWHETLRNMTRSDTTGESLIQFPGIAKGLFMFCEKNKVTSNSLSVVAKRIRRIGLRNSTNTGLLKVLLNDNIGKITETALANSQKDAQINSFGTTLGNLTAEFKCDLTRLDLKRTTRSDITTRKQWHAAIQQFEQFSEFVCAAQSSLLKLEYHDPFVLDKMTDIIDHSTRAVVSLLTAIQNHSNKKHSRIGFFSSKSLPASQTARALLSLINGEDVKINRKMEKSFNRQPFKQLLKLAKDNQCCTPLFRSIKIDEHGVKSRSQESMSDKNRKSKP